MSFQRLRLELSRKNKTLICGTGPSIEVLKDAKLRDALQKEFNIFCVNTAHHYFTEIDVLFIGFRCGYTYAAKPEHFTNKNIKFFISGDNRNAIKTCFIPVVLDFDPQKNDTISTDITAPLPFGPTTILDYAIPTAMFCEMKNLYLLGADYPVKTHYARFDQDSNYRPYFKYKIHGEMFSAQKKWLMWFEYFKEHGVTIQSFSPACELPIPKIDLNSFLEKSA